MQIKIYPSEIIKLCLWDNFTYYVIGSEKEAEKILKEDKEFEISERDALVIGLLKIIETDNLIHKFNTYMVDFLNNKSINNQNLVLIRKNTLDLSIDKFLEKFPSYWTPDIVYKKAIEQVDAYIKEYKTNIDELEIHKVTDQFGTYDFLNSNTVKKLLSFNY